MFGCLCFISTPSVHSLKFESRALPCVFLGYPFNMKGYKVLTLHTRKISISRDVIFHESIFPFSPSYKSLLSNSPPLSIPLLASCNPTFDVSSSTEFVSAGTPLSISYSPSILVGSLPIPLLAAQIDTIPGQSPSLSVAQPVMLPSQSPSLSVAQPVVLPGQSSSLSVDTPTVLSDQSISLPVNPPTQFVSIRKSARVSNKPAYLADYKCN